MSDVEQVWEWHWRMPSFSSASLTHFFSFLSSSPMAVTAQAECRALAGTGDLVTASRRRLSQVGRVGGVGRAREE